MGVRAICIALLLIVSFSCSTQKIYQNNLLFSSNHSGFILKDPSKEKVLADVNSAKYFTPASNTKIFTLYAGIIVLGDSIPALKYQIEGDSLIFWGTGDPTFLNSDFPDNPTFNFLSKSNKELYFSSSNYHDTRMGPGWAWDDYNYSYSLEKSAFPVYGNKIEVHKGADTTELKVTPNFFEKFIYFESSPAPVNSNYLQRELSSNLIKYYPLNDTISFTRNIPITWNADFFKAVLSDTLKRDLKILDKDISGSESYLYGLKSDSVYQTMMYESDNFLAEQILLMVADAVSDTLRSDLAIDYIKNNYLMDLPDEPLWVDGSGLSRYNLFTPRSIVVLLEKLYNEIDRDRLFHLFAGGGENGTIKDWYGGDPTYVFAKTGTLRNNHCLSGYIITKSGKTLIFSFMNNNYNDVSSTFKKEMEKMLKYIYNKY